MATWVRTLGDLELLEADAESIDMAIETTEMAPGGPASGADPEGTAFELRKASRPTKEPR